jgi:hypothetical protein
MRKIYFLISFMLIPAFSMAQDRVTGHSFATRSEVIAPYGMAATSQPLATMQLMLPSPQMLFFVSRSRPVRVSEVTFLP